MLKFKWCNIKRCLNFAEFYGESFALLKTCGVEVMRLLEKFNCKEKKIEPLVEVANVDKLSHMFWKN
jgi:hypothetical protein